MICTYYQQNANCQTSQTITMILTVQNTWCTINKSFVANIPVEAMSENKNFAKELCKIEKKTHQINYI